MRHEEKSASEKRQEELHVRDYERLKCERTVVGQWSRRGKEDDRDEGLE